MQTLGTRLDNHDVNWIRRQNRNTVLDITHTLHFRRLSQTAPLRIPARAEQNEWQDGPWITSHYSVPHRRKNPPMTLWRYLGKKKHSFSNIEPGHNQRHLELLSNQFRKWDSVFISARRNLSANAINGISVPNRSVKLHIASWNVNYRTLAVIFAATFNERSFLNAGDARLHWTQRLFKTFMLLFFPPRVISVLKYARIMLHYNSF